MHLREVKKPVSQLAGVMEVPERFRLSDLEVKVLVPLDREHT
jgi:hypothetical protein